MDNWYFKCRDGSYYLGATKQELKEIKDFNDAIPHLKAMDYLIVLMGKGWCYPTGIMQRYLQGQAKHDPPDRQYGTPAPRRSNFRQTGQTYQPYPLDQNRSGIGKPGLCDSQPNFERSFGWSTFRRLENRPRSA